MTLEELGLNTKRKYPQYKNLTNQRVGELVLKRYPVYKTQIRERTKKETASSVIEGAGKGVLRSIRGIVKAVTPKRFESKLGLDRMLPEQLSKPQSKPEQVGFIAESIAEFFTPAAATKGLKVAIKAKHIPTSLQILSRSMIEAAEVMGVSKIQGAEKGEILTSGGIAAGIPLVGGALQSVIKPVMKSLTEKLSPRLINAILKPREKQFSFGKQPASGVISEGIVGKSRGDLLIKLTKRKQEVGKLMDDALNKVSDKKLDLKGITEPVDSAIKKAAASGDQTLVNRLQDLRKGLVTNFRLGADGAIEEIGKKNLILSPKAAQQMKIEIGKNTRWTGQAFDNDINKVRVKVYRLIDDILDKNVKGMDKLNSRYANLLTAETALERSNKALQRLNSIGLREAILGVGAFTGSLGFGEDTGTSATRALGAIAAGRLISSTPARTQAVQILRKLSESERDSILQLSPVLRNLFLGLQQNTEDNPAE